MRCVGQEHDFLEKGLHHPDSPFDEPNAVNLDQGLVAAVTAAFAAHEDEPCNVFKRMLCVHEVLAVTPFILYTNPGQASPKNRFSN
jgi:hypothetical protein